MIDDTSIRLREAREKLDQLRERNIRASFRNDMFLFILALVMVFGTLAIVVGPVLWHNLGH